MNISLVCPDLDLPTVSVIAGIDTLVLNALNVAAKEWDVNATEFDVTFEGEQLPIATRLTSHGIVGDSILVFVKTKL